MATYEVQVRRSGEWFIDSFHEDIDQAVLELQRLKSQNPNVRISAETYDEETKTFQSKRINLRAKEAYRPNEESLLERRAKRLAHVPNESVRQPGSPRKMNFIRGAFYVFAAASIALLGFFSLIGLQVIVGMV